jgi:hypothetical protein
MNHKDTIPILDEFDNALGMAAELVHSGPAAKPLLCFDTTQRLWAVVDCMQPDQVAALCWLPDLKPVTLASVTSLTIIAKLQEVALLEAYLLDEIVNKTEPPYLVDLLIAANECESHSATVKENLGLSSEPTKVCSDDGGAVPPEQL